MRLTLDAGSGAFVFDGLAVGDLDILHDQHGLATAAPNWPSQPAVVTRSEYAALAFWDAADEPARAALADLHGRYAASRALGTAVRYGAPHGHEYLPFQHAGIEYALARSNALIGDEMGVGKTIQAIGVANELGARRILIVCPAAIRPHWRDKIAGTRAEPGWSRIPGVRAYPIYKSSDGVDPFANFVIVSYDLLSSPGIHEALLRLDWDLLVLDEMHYLKTTTAKRTQAIFGKLRHKERTLAERCQRILGLTGTPLPNRPRECYTALRHLAWDAIDWQSEEAFKARYNPSRRIIVPAKNDDGTISMKYAVQERTGHLPELRARLRCNVMVRRLMSAVMPQLPERRYELTYVEPCGSIRKALAAESLLGIDPLRLENVDPEIWGHVSAVRKQMGLAKVPRVVEFVRVLMESEQKAFVLFHHRDVGSALAEALTAYDPILLWGGLGPIEVHARKERFIAEPKHRVLLGQIEVAGTGLDGLQKVCRIATFAEASWTPKDNEQALYRLRRIGQTRGVLGQFLVAEGGWDEKVLLANHVKAKSIHATLDQE